MFLCIAASVIMLSLLMHAARLTIDPLGEGIVPYYLAGGVAIFLRLNGERWIPRYGRVIADCAEYYALFTGIALIGAVASYPIAALTYGFHDAALQRIDVALGFDWLAWYRTVAEHPLLQHIGLAAYRSIYLTPAILLGWFAWHGDRAAAHRFLITFWLAALVTLALYVLMPAVGPLAYLWHAPLPYMPESELWQEGLIPALRDHRVGVIDLSHLRGIVSAPSFHTAAAVLYIHTAWSRRELRWPILAINIAMLLATPVEGTHYFIDMILGAVVAVVAILAVKRIVSAPPP
ncbi:conserved membrane hypothetical protein [Sphingomonas sp. EC-HK361]|uniref:phosphatase PAP2 family protein n=1 Tax=Sphingomonas sp. EC-HK361 TaxID=2038397 RepID=UPI001250DC43|nr:phosphatase PAP2 family protein [Sphingomonas sp. EC-HK361]VVT22237.1 conserved membrane hypothetical protein [Sphingomonas sp. EC-HK361]